MPAGRKPWRPRTRDLFDFRGTIHIGPGAVAAVALMPSFNVPNEARIEINVYVLMFCVIISAFTPAFSASMPTCRLCRLRASDFPKRIGRANGFEPSTSWSRTRKSKIHKCGTWCRLRGRWPLIPALELGGSWTEMVGTEYLLFGS